MTQALALAGFLRSAGHDLIRVLVGTSPFRSVPEYFGRRIQAPLETFDAPTQVPDRAGQGASAGATLWDVAVRTPAFLRGAARIRSATRGADVVVNFLDLMAGLSRLWPGTHTPSVAVAHNYLFLHPRLGRLPGPALTRRLVMTYVRATAARCETRIALSFGPMGEAGGDRLAVAPPLLRPGLEALHVSDGDYLLAYALNPGYGAVLAEWQRRHPEVPVHCYLDGGTAALKDPPPDGFHAHALNDEAFLRHLAGCRAYVGSAGFESICEALYLGKPALAVPTAGHFEQTLNGWDAQRAGAARVGSYHDVGEFWAEPPVPSARTVSDFRSWVARAPETIVGLIERAASGAR
ncbi:MAG: UDP- glucuronosyltransferase [Gemmatimonadota bacterium]|nr:UDP- glucuronosyltransferase [Gemmatimonadota bacterium]MDH3424545.1 UDP- glucuronosyltransferase [Gemmatimonadota bacterium]